MTLLWLFLGLLAAEDVATCVEFTKGTICPLHPANIIAAVSGVEDEAVCQSNCATTTTCNYFTFIEFGDRNSLCVLVNACEVAEATNCANTIDCDFALSGPSDPPIMDACCGEFRKEECDTETPFMTVTDVEDIEFCQHICRDESSCSFFTLFINVCFLYTSCASTSPCGLCSSGPAYPLISSCPQDGTTPAPQGHTSALLLGGVTSKENPTDSIELITSETACEPKLPSLPVKSRGSGAVVLGEKIIYCGGYSGFQHYHTYYATCYSLDIGKVFTSNSFWRQEASMTTSRGEFGMTVVGDKVFAIGGRQDDDNRHKTVESFHPDLGWTLEEDMALSKTRLGHCTVTLDESIYAIAGFVNGNGSPSVIKFDLGQNSTREWVNMASLETTRYYPACAVGQFEGRTGIFVSGGNNMDNNGYITREKSVEFYTPEEDRWTTVHRMLLVREYHTMAEINGVMTVAGGESYSTSLTPTVECFDGTIWNYTSNITVARALHTSVNVPANYVSCKP